ncbi:hypothetical protein ACFLZW_02080 [Chloroflexota bacterium]
MNYFWQSCIAWGGGATCGVLPWTMTDSGWNVQNGYSPSFTATSTTMIETSLARPPLASITAAVGRVGSHYHFDINITNLSGATLSAANEARVFAFIYEVKPPDHTTHLTSHPARAVVSSAIASLADQASGNFTLDTPDLNGVVWENLHPAVIVTYRPGGAGSGWYDTLQAAFEYAPVQLFLPLIITP